MVYALPESLGRLCFFHNILRFRVQPEAHIYEWNYLGHYNVAFSTIPVARTTQTTQILAGTYFLPSFCVAVVAHIPVLPHLSRNAKKSENRRPQKYVGKNT